MENSIPVNQSAKDKAEQAWAKATNIVAKNNGIGSTLVTGHMAKYWREAADLFSNQMISDFKSALKKRIEKEIEDVKQWVPINELGRTEKFARLQALTDFLQSIDEVEPEV